MSKNGREEIKDIMIELKTLRTLIAPMVRKGSVYKKGVGYTILKWPTYMLISFLRQIEYGDISLKHSSYKIVSSDGIITTFDSDVVPEITISSKEAHEAFDDYKDGKGIVEYLNELLELIEPMLQECPYNEGEQYTEFFMPLNCLDTVLCIYENKLFVQSS